MTVGITRHGSIWIIASMVALCSGRAPFMTVQRSITDFASPKDIKLKRCDTFDLTAPQRNQAKLKFDNALRFSYDLWSRTHAGAERLSAGGLQSDGNRKAIAAYLADLEGAQNITVPVVIHVIWYKDGDREVGKLGMAAIADQIKVLNDGFQNGFTPCDEPNWKPECGNPAMPCASPPPAKTHFQFMLQSIDDHENKGWCQGMAAPTVGLPDTYVEECQAAIECKVTLRSPGRNVLNIYTVPSETLLGWATMPQDHVLKVSGQTRSRVENAMPPGHPKPTDADIISMLDGIVLNASTFPSIDQSIACKVDEPDPHPRLDMLSRFQMGRTAVHETGHWLGLFHTFYGRCGSYPGRLSQVPREKVPYYGTPRHWWQNGAAVLSVCYPKSCGQDSSPRDPIEDFMDYSDDAVMTRFYGTENPDDPEGQQGSMEAWWKAFRANSKVVGPDLMPLAGGGNVRK